MIRQALLLARRDAAAFLGTPIAGVVVVTFLVVQGFSFWAVVSVLADPRRPAPYGAVLREHFGGSFLHWVFLFFLAAVLTMRLVAEERRQGTWETLRTTAVGAPAIVAGKWLGALAAWIVLWLPTLAHVGFLAWLAPPGAAPDPGPIATAYLGVLVTGGSALSVGLLASALVRNQVVAAVLAFVALLLVLFAGLLPELSPGTPSALAEIVDVRRHMDDFARGIVDLRHLAVLAGLAAVALTASGVAITVERRPRALASGALGVVLVAAAAVLAVAVAARHPVRLDATRAGVYTLDARTRHILEGVTVPVDVLVVHAGEPAFADLYDEVHELLRAFRAVAPGLRVSTFDPALDPSRVAELAGELVLSPDEVAGGGAVVLRAGGRRRAVALLDMATFADARLVSFRGEEALASALLEVTDPSRPEICFTTGHDEPSIDDGLGRVAAALHADTAQLQPLERVDPVPARCAALVVMGPRRPFAESEAAAVAAWLDRGGRLLVALGEGPTGLERVLERHGIKVQPGVVVDPAAEIGVPLVWGTLHGYGAHVISASFLGRRLTVWHRPRWVTPLPLPGVTSAPLVSSSERGWAETGLPPGAVETPERPDAGDAPGPAPIAVAAESTASGARVVVFGSASSFLDEALERTGAANDALVASSIAWLTGRARLVGIGPKTPEQLRLVLSTEARTRLFVATVVGLPALCALIFVALGWMRRRAR